MQDWIMPDWPAPPRVMALNTTRLGGFSSGVYRSLNLGTHVGDNPDHVKQNRQYLIEQSGMPAEPRWLEQVHGIEVAEFQHNEPCAVHTADASYTSKIGVVLTVMTADCLPILVCNRAATHIAAIHAGWRGLANGIIESTFNKLPADQEWLVWLGPAISQDYFEVGDEVRARFIGLDPLAAQGFQHRPDSGKWLADIYALARQRLQEVGVRDIFGGEFCTYRDSARFYSYRRDGTTGRMAACIWLAG